MASADLLEALVKLEDRPWAECSHGKSLTGAKLARLLKGFKVTAAGSDEGRAEDGLRAYRREAFTDAWTRYLRAETPSKECRRDNPNNDGPEPAISMRDTDEECHGLKSEDSSINTGACHTVTLENPVSGADERTEAEDGLF